MKQINLLIIALCALILSSCKKDKKEETTEPGNFAQITLSDIKKKESLMSDEAFQTSGVNGVGWKTDDVYVYRTRSGMYGKFRVGSIVPAENYKLTISAVTFKQEGSVYKETDKLVIRGTYGANLEEMEEGASMSEIDFQWVRQDQVNTMFTPTNGAAFIVYRLN